MSRAVSVFFLSLITVMGSACTWVQLSVDAEDVELVKAAEVSECKKIGNTTSNVMSKFGFYDRDEEKVGEELLNLARNETIKMGGNTLVADSAITEGSQRFAVYSCP